MIKYRQIINRFVLSSWRNKRELTVSILAPPWFHTSKRKKFHLKHTVHTKLNIKNEADHSSSARSHEPHEQVHEPPQTIFYKPENSYYISGTKIKKKILWA